MKNRFKKMMDNSEEGIIIIKDQLIDYINDKFAEQQRRTINTSILENRSDSTAPPSLCTKLLQKLKQFFAKNQEKMIN